MRRRPGEAHAGRAQALVLGLHVVHAEEGGRHAVGMQGGLERPGGRVHVGLQQQFHAIGIAG